jgi:hypothetical protein
MTTPDMQAAHLSAAVGHIREVWEAQDMRVSPCGSCGRDEYENLTEFRRAEQLDGIIQKLERIIGSIRADDVT